MKKLLILTCLLALTLGSFATEVNEEVMKIFNRTYPEAKSITWEEMKDGYKVFFVRNEVSYRLMYDEQGNVTLALKYYGEENLPPLILNKLKKNYKDFKVHSVVEEATDTALTYHIVLENDKKIVNVKSDAIGYLETVSKYNKG
ncbi:MAG: hypothetical protein JO301_11375 [Chitinophagaceae bacterium]|nr:hypothetical protein [Chitinophagaceae bacterium]